MTTIATRRLMPAAAGARSARWLVLAGAVLVQLILGTVYGYSVFWQPLEAEVWTAVGTAVGTAAGDATAIPADPAHRQGLLKYTFAICIFAFAAAMVPAGRLQDRVGPRLTATVGAFLLAIAFLLPAHMDAPATYYVCHALIVAGIIGVGLLVLHRAWPPGAAQSPTPRRWVSISWVVVSAACGIALMAWMVPGAARDRLMLLWITVGLFAGVGIGFAYVCPIAALVKWFPQHKGLVSGLAVAGFGAGALLFSNKSIFGAVGFIDTWGIQTFFFVHALVCLLVVSAGAAMLRNPPGEPATTAVAASESTWQQPLRSGRFYVVWAMFFSGAMAGLMVIGILKPFAGSQLIQRAVAGGAVLGESARHELLLAGAGAVGVLAVFNALGRVVWGFVSDRMGRTPTLILMFTLQGATLLALVALQSRWQLAVGAALVGFNFGGNFALFPSLTADLFGTRNMGANYGWVFTSYGVAGLSGIWVGNTAQRVTGSYFAAFALAAALCFASAVLAMLLHRATALRRTARARTCD